MLIFLGWFLLSVQNNKSSIIAIFLIGALSEKFKKDPSTNVRKVLVTVSYSTIKDSTSSPVENVLLTLFYFYLIFNISYIRFFIDKFLFEINNT